ncbi:MAG TPA: CRTAC1 family protein [Gammaproteobacteria bacterium]|nr:CRTAC1 family protein [Gammaproteobacteria bacterium]
MHFKNLIVLLVLLITACGGGSGGSGTGPMTPAPGNTVDDTENPPPDPDPDPDPQTGFTDVTAASGFSYISGVVYDDEDITDADISVRMIATNGAAAGDYDNDGDIDVFIVRGNFGANQLYRNDGGLTFTDVAEEAGVALLGPGESTSRQSGPTFADVDGDGDLDLFMRGVKEESVLMRNDGDGTFTDATNEAGLLFLRRHGMSSAFGDYDMDGDLDLVTTHWGSPQDRDDPGDTEHLWRNDTEGDNIAFTSVSELAQISPSIAQLPDPNAFRYDTDRTFTPTFARIDDDRFPDLLMVADFNQTQYFHNNGDGTFENSTDVEVFVDGNGMGSAVGDYDNDGDLDWFVSSILHPSDDPMPNTVLSELGNRLYQNHQGVFTDVTDEAGVADGGWGWGACFIDFENDGDLDIYHTNGWQEEVLTLRDFPEHEGYQMDAGRAFVNQSDGTFVEQAETLGLHDTEMGRGVVCADFDNDGDTDILLLADGPTLWRNDESGNEYLKVRLIGTAPNTEAAGARISLSSENTNQIREISIGSNFLSQNPAIQLFGLGSDTSADITVSWPDGSETVMTDVASGQTLEIAQ